MVTEHHAGVLGHRGHRNPERGDVLGHDDPLLGGVDWAHRDPFDRVIATTAMVEGLLLVTDDDAFSLLDGIRTLW